MATSKRWTSVPLLAIAWVALAGCRPSESAPAAARVSPEVEVCAGVHAMIGKEITTTYDISTSKGIALKISAAAEADVARLKVIKEAKGDAGAGAQLGSEIRAVVQTKSQVTTDFFQQDQSFAQAACFIGSLLNRADLSAADQQFFEQQRRALAVNRVAYLDVLTGLKKK